MWVKLAAQVVVVVLNYVISKLFVFKIAKCGIFNKIIRTIIVCVWYNKA